MLVLLLLLAITRVWDRPVLVFHCIGRQYFLFSFYRAFAAKEVLSLDRLLVELIGYYVGMTTPVGR